MTYRIPAISITLSHFQGHVSIAGLLECEFLAVVQQLTKFKLT